MEIRPHPTLAQLFRRRRNDTATIQSISDHETHAMRRRYANNEESHRKYEYKSLFVAVFVCAAALVG